jgi:ribonuclease HI
VKNERLKELHDHVSTLAALFKSFRIAWVPREMNADADRLVRNVLDGAST